MNIYYEGLCPDSRHFITNVLYPQYKLFSESLNLRFIPFGKASVRHQHIPVYNQTTSRYSNTIKYYAYAFQIREDGSEYQCQHGKEECIRNIIHGCALDVLKPGDEQVEFVYCAMINKSLHGQKEVGSTWGII